MINKRKERYLLNEMAKAGLSSAEAIQYIEYNDRCNWEGICRKWRKFAEEVDKNRQAEEAYRESYSPVTHTSLNRQEQIRIQRQIDNTNQTLF